MYQSTKFIKQTCICFSINSKYYILLFFNKSIINFSSSKLQLTTIYRSKFYYYFVRNMAPFSKLNSSVAVLALLLLLIMSSMMAIAAESNFKHGRFSLLSFL
ncbi:hypothetical protein QL285_015593 [Trifolium repens]|nr:hypothetical protein QL285_015593 [Trifolium repens]